MQHVDAEMAKLGHLSPHVAREVQPVMPADLQRIAELRQGCSPWPGGSCTRAQ